MSRTASDSYAPRSFPGHPGDCVEIEGAGVCWGPVRNSSSGMRCEGHRSAIYRSEPVPPTPEEIAAQKAARAEGERKNRALMREIAYKWGWTLEELEEELQGSRQGPKEWDEWQAGRWFRPFMYGVGDIERSPWMPKLSKPMLLFLHAAIGHYVSWDNHVPPHVHAAMRLLGAKVTRELQIRGTSRWPSSPYGLKLKGSAPREKGVAYRSNRKTPFTEKESAIRADLFTDAELRICFSLASEVMDFSCLDWGTRCADDAWYFAMKEEIQRRGLGDAERGVLVEEIELPIPPMIVEDEGRPKVIGYWAGKHGREAFAGLPVPESYVDESWGRSERVTLLRYLSQGWKGDPICYMGSSSCRICGQENGCKEYTDGTYVWPEGFAHYIEAHHVKPAQEFIDHVLSQPA